MDNPKKQEKSTLKQGYSWGRRDFGLDWDIVVAVISTCPNKKCLVNLQKRFSPKSPPKKRPKVASDSVIDGNIQMTPTTTKEKPLKPLNTLIQEMKALQATKDRKTQKAPRPLVQPPNNTFQWNGNHPYSKPQRIEEIRPKRPPTLIQPQPSGSYILFPEDAHNHHPCTGRVFRQIAPRPLAFTRVVPSSHDLNNLSSLFRSGLCVQSSMSAGNHGRSDLGQKQNDAMVAPRVLDLSKKPSDEKNSLTNHVEPVRTPSEVLPGTRCFIKLMPKVDGTNGNGRDFSTLYDQLLKSVNTMRGKVRLVLANQGRGKSGDQFRAQNEFCLKAVREMQVRLAGDGNNSG